ncbi:MAG TPA: serine hydrolase domain-containing protein [Kofleriaceae bacterium]|nr:serine hydrolase domain-containing protein [Kofleriaceae bacterium]
MRLSRTIRRFDPDDVTSRDGGRAEADPRDAGLRRADVDAIWDGARALYRSRLYPAIALSLRRRGQVLLDRAIGHARGNAPDDPPGARRVPATPRTLFNLFSASKSVTAMLIHLLDQRRRIHLDDPVAEYIPGFGRHGKQWITIRHVLTHRSGIPSVPGGGVDLDLLVDGARIVELLCEARPTVAPGRRLAYHALTGGFVLGEIIRRVTGADARALLAAEIERPLGLEHFNYGVAAAELERIAFNARTGPPVPPPMSLLLRRALGVDLATAVTASNDPRFLASVIPAGNIYTTADQACRFMQLLLDGGAQGGVRIFEPRTVARAVAETSYLEMDLTLGMPVRYGMGFMLGSEHVAIYGRHTARAYGHVGFTNVVMYADPERELALCLMTSGKPVLAAGVLRWLGLLHRIARLVPRRVMREV